jgi:hypothetical protein
MKLKKRAQVAGLASMTLVVASLGVMFATHAANAAPNAPAKSAPPGDNGDVKIHNSTTAVTDQRNEPHVCQFYLDGFNFDPNQSVTWYIVPWSPGGDHTTHVLSGTLTMDANGDGHTADQSLQNGHYKLFWNFTGEHGAAKHKVFWVKCPVAPPTTPPPTTTPPTTPTTTPPTTPTTPPTTAPTTPPTTPPPAAPAPTPVSGSLPVTG